MRALIVVLVCFLKFSEQIQATEFGPNDIYNPDPHLACWKALGRHYDDLLTEDDLVVAHRTLPCGQPVMVCNPRTSLCVLARVGDRGPFGRYRQGKRKGEYIAQVDLATAVARRIKFNGFEPVVMWPVEDWPEPPRLASW